MKLDIDEMYRFEDNGDDIKVPAYTNKEIFEGSIVELDEECGLL